MSNLKDWPRLHKPLTARQDECLRHVARGYATDEIARLLSLSPHTINKYIEEAMRKLDAAGRGRRAVARDYVQAYPAGSPDQFVLEPLGVEADPDLPVEQPLAGEGSEAPRTGGEGGPSLVASVWRYLPLRGRKERRVDLTRTKVLVWVPLLALLIMILLGLTLSNLETTKRLRQEGVIGPLNPPSQN